MSIEGCGNNSLTEVIFKGFGGFTLHIRQYMTVGIEGYGEASVTNHLTDYS
jgi:hypothetical protein